MLQALVIRGIMENNLSKPKNSLITNKTMLF